MKSKRGQWSKNHSTQCGICKLTENIENMELNDYMDIHEQIKTSKCYNFQKCRIPIKTKFDIPYISEQLQNYNDNVIIEFLKYGWPINFNGTIPKKQYIKNHKGALEYSDEIEEYLEKELKNNAILGPFKSNPFHSKIVISPLNTLPKGNDGERRVILDLSFPRQCSINSGIEKELKLSYPSIDNLVELIKKKGKCCLLYKCDLKRAYRQIPIDPGDVNLLGYKWKKHIFFDKVLAMRSSAMICQRVTNSIAFILKNNEIEVVNFLDDFGGAEIKEKASQTFETVKNTINTYGLELALEKCYSPWSTLVFLGILVKSVSMTLEVTPQRLAETNELLMSWENKKTASKFELQSLLGKLNFVAKCVKPARLFISRMLELLRNMPNHGHMQISEEFMKDVYWWKKFLPKYNGISMMLIEDWTKPDELVSCDACLTGCGGWFDGNYFHTTFPKFIDEQKIDINGLELLTLVVCVKLWGKSWKGKRILINCDNKASVIVLNTGKTHNVFLQKCLREL